MAEKITILFPVTDLELHGAQHQLLELVRGLDKQRFKPIVLTLTPGGPMEREYRAIPGSRLFCLERKGKWDFLLLLRVFTLLRKMKVDVIQPFLTPATFYTLLPALLYRTPVKIVTERASRINIRTGLGYRLYLKAEDLLSRFSDLAVANSSAGREYLIERGINASRAKVIYNGIDVSNYIRDGRVVEQVKQKLALPPGGKVVGMTARMFPVKRHDEFLRAAAIVREAVSGTRFVLLGDGPLRGNLEDLSRQLGLGSEAVFAGEQSDVIPYLANFDIFALVSETEGLSLSICEAMAMGKPVVASDVGGNRELVEDGSTGFLVPQGDITALAEAIICLLQQPDMARAMGQRAKEKIVAQFGLQRYVEEYQSLYEEALLQRKGRWRLSRNEAQEVTTVSG